jgi:imidazolonepropionase-like amidohydrolase
MLPVYRSAEHNKLGDGGVKMQKLLKCGKILSVRDGNIITDGVIVVKDDVIVFIGKANEYQTSSPVQEIDLSGMTVLPGMIDCHTHLKLHFGDPPGEIYPEPELYEMLKCVRNMRWDIRCGLTTIRNLSERSYRAVPLKHAINNELIPGPRILSGIRGIRPTHGWGMNAFGFDGVDALRKAIRENVAAGADLIKIYVTGEAWKDTSTACYMTKEEIQACTDEAHMVGLKIAAHCHGGIGLRYCLEAGIDTIEHGAMMTEDDINLFLKHGTTLIATFNPYMHEATLASPRSKEFVAGVKRVQANMNSVFPKALKSGIKFSIGTDARHGNYVFELETLVNFGLSPMEAICAGTYQAALALGIDNNTGSLEVGKWADIIAVNGDPLLNISALRDIRFVMKAGIQQELSEK